MTLRVRGWGFGRDGWVRVRGCCDVEGEGLGVGRDGWVSERVL